MRENRPVWVCELVECGHVWLASGSDAPDRCAKCKRRGWHKTQTGAELVRESGAGLDERIAEIARRVFREEWAAVPVEDEAEEMPAVADVSALPVSDRLAIARAAVAAVGSPVGVAAPVVEAREPCPYRDPPNEAGDIYGCALHLGHKGKHVPGPKVGDIW